jgi:hypothetical protein
MLYSHPLHQGPIGKFGLPRCRPGHGGSPDPSLALKVFIDAWAEIRVPSSEKCSSDRS